MEQILNIAQVILGVLLVIVIVLQAKGDGLGAAISGGSGTIASTRRGPEKGLFVTTIVLAVLFFGIAASRLFMPTL